MRLFESGWTVLMPLCFFWVAVIFLIGLAACATAHADGREGFVPFNVGRAGSVATIDIHVSYLSRSYPRSVVLKIGPFGNDWLDGRNNRKIDLTNVFDDLFFSLSGKRFYSYDGSNEKPHKGVRLFVTWKEKKSGRILQGREVVADHAMNRVCSGLGACLSIDSMPLEAGDYVVIVRVLDDDPRFDGTFETELFAGYTWK